MNLKPSPFFLDDSSRGSHFGKRNCEKGETFRGDSHDANLEAFEGRPREGNLGEALQQICIH